MRAMTISERLKSAANDPDTRLGLVFIDRREKETHYAFDTVLKRALGAAGSLKRKGINKGDRVAIILPTCIEFMDVFFGCQLIGAIPVPMYPPVRLGRLTEYFNRSAVMLQSIQVKAIVSDKRVSKVLGQLLARVKPDLGLLSAEGLHKGNPISFTAPHPDDMAMAQFSSGTTNKPKAVGLTHRQILSNVDLITNEIPFESTATIPTGVSWLPLYHDMGLIGCLIPAVSVPGKMAFIPPEMFLAKPALWLRAISRHKAIISPAPNFAYALCAERIQDKDLEGVDLSHWKMALNGAESVAPDHLRAFIERFKGIGFRQEAMMPVYGLAEAALAVSFSSQNSVFESMRFDRLKMQQGVAQPTPNQDENSIEMTHVGQPLPGFEIEIRKNGHELPSGQIGEIWIKGPSIMDGYISGNESPIVDGWLKTGDIGFVFNHQLYISGREKDVVIIRGQNHSPSEIEQAVDSIDGVRTGCSVAVSNIAEHGDQLLLFVEFKQRREGIEEECMDAVLSKTGIRPDKIILLKPGSIPRTSSGKLRRQETLKRYLIDELTAPKAVNAFTMAGVLAKSAASRLLNRQ